MREMFTGVILVSALLALTALAVRNGHTLPVPQPVFCPAPSAVDGALRVTRARLARGEIDIRDYLRISTVLMDNPRTSP
ncbi:MAG: hypothetical protein Q8K89_09815 [Actinomycetota bacterium]|nr:hypothetical protein [Actinomycetota bacterium]